MSARILALLVLSFVQFSATSAHAQWFSNFWNEFKHDYSRNKHWPEPMVHNDRMAVAVPIGMMVSKGWQKQMLLCDYHFEADSEQLNQAGEMHVRYILTQAPVRHRTIFVQRGLTPDVTADRIASVQQAVMRMQPHAQPPAIVESDMWNEGSSAESVDLTFKALKSTQPAPRLPAPKGDEPSK